jgi:prevent-host-death family protein
MVTRTASARSVTSKEAVRNWKAVSDEALHGPVVITSHGKPRHVLLSYAEYAAMRDSERQVVRTEEVSGALADEILEGLEALRRPYEGQDRDDLVIG